MVLYKLATKSTNFIIIYLWIDLNSSLYHRIYRDRCLKMKFSGKDTTTLKISPLS